MRWKKTLTARLLPASHVEREAGWPKGTRRTGRPRRHDAKKNIKNNKRTQRLSLPRSGAYRGASAVEIKKYMKKALPSTVPDKLLRSTGQALRSLRGRHHPQAFGRASRYHRLHPVI
ncbi:hypothetical protein KJ656_15205 [bacterium]|nr:hypothetical protein [bacterium]